MTLKHRVTVLCITLTLSLASLAGLIYLMRQMMYRQQVLEQRLDTYYVLVKRLYHNQGGEAWYGD